MTPTPTGSITPTPTGSEQPSETPTATPTGSAQTTPVPGPGFDIKLSKQDVAGKEIAKAELTFTSLDGYDLSTVEVTQGGTTITPRLSADKKSISFDTVEGQSTILKAVKPGRYQLSETVTPKAYLTADAITFTLKDNGDTDCGGVVSVAGSPIVMVDKADPTYKQGGGSLPATGEQMSGYTVAGYTILALAAACAAGYVVYRTKKKKT